MYNRERLNAIFRSVFLLGPEEPLEDKTMLNVDAWNSVEHFAFVSELEESFGIRLKQEDIIAMTSYSAVLAVLKKYGV